MCDFLSICVRLDGAIAHVPENSHSGAISANKWTENDTTAELRGRMRFVEVEWNCKGPFPGAEKIARGDINEKQRKVIETFYNNAKKLLEDPAENAERMCLNGGYFSAEQFADLRWKAMVHPKCPKRVVAKLAETSLHADGEEIRSLHPKVSKLGGNLRIAEGCKITAPALTEVAGSVDVQQGATLTAPALTEVAGYVDVRQGATLTAPALTEVAGSVYVRQGATLDAPKLKRKN